MVNNSFLKNPYGCVLIFRLLHLFPDATTGKKCLDSPILKQLLQALETANGNEKYK